MKPMFILRVENFNYNIFDGMRSINVIMWREGWNGAIKIAKDNLTSEVRYNLSFL
jgi:hypothetical protein